MQPLSGKRVLDLSRLLPGPYCSQRLLRLGAEVVKVEGPDGGDYLRYFEPQVDGISAYFRALNRGKKSLEINLKSDSGKAVFLRLAQQSDIVIEGFRPGVMDSLGLGYEQLHAVNPRLILCSISGYGQHGPRRHRAGHDLNYMALSGALSATGTKAGEVAIPSVQVADLAGGAMSATIAILAALLDVAATGQGRHLDIAMFAGVVDWLEPQFQAYEANGDVPQAGQDLLNGGVPCYRVYRCADGWISVAALEPKFWQRLVAVLQMPHLLDKAFVRGDASQTVQREMEAKFLEHSRAEWLAILNEEDLCCEPVLDLGEAAADAMVKRVRNSRRDTSGSVPGKGEHTEEILQALGLTSREIAALFSDGAVA